METFTKLLVARHSTQNGCHVPDGQVLIVLPRRSVSLNKDTGHRFVSSLDVSLNSKFGWVADSEPFTLDEFIDRHLKGTAIEEEAKGHIALLLSSIARLPAGTPVAATYFIRGDVDRRSVFVIHKVVLYFPKN
jgi:hypothetical protein